MSRSGLFDGLMYALVVAALLAGTVSLFLVAIDVGASLGVAAFLGSLLLFPLTLLVGPIMVGLESGDWSAAYWLGLSLAFGAMPLLFTLRARRTAVQEPQREPNSRQRLRSRS